MSSTKVISYTNGNTTVTILEDGTKTRTYTGEPKPAHPESIDVKITNYCDLGCAYCHEDSTTAGVHGDLNQLKNTLQELPRGVELAVGGGNPLAHPDLENFLVWAKEKGFFVNLTVNQGHIASYIQDIRKYVSLGLVKAIGISVTRYDIPKEIQLIKCPIVFHIILGVHHPKLAHIALMARPDDAILLLGFKTFGRGVLFHEQEAFPKKLQTQINLWKRYLQFGVFSTTVAFDNLAIEQLQLKTFMEKEVWESFYMGDDGQFTMYVDAVNQEYAITSRSSERTSFRECSLIDFFTSLQK